MRQRVSFWKAPGRKRAQMLLYMFLGLLLALAVLAPVLWMFLTSVMRAVDLTAKPLKLIPETITFERFGQVFQSASSSDPAYVFRIALINSFIIAAAVTLLSLVVGSLSAYAFAQVRFRGKGKLMLMILFTYMLPPAALIIPLYRIYNQLGWLDRKGPLVILYLSFIVPFIIWVMQDFFGSISKSFEEAAQVDGATDLQVFWRIKWPNIMPTTLYILVITTINSFQCFALIQLLTSGGPTHSTDTIMYYIYYTAFKLYRYGYGNAMGVILAIIIAILSAVQFKLGQEK